jgi:hypothetical protein
MKCTKRTSGCRRLLMTLMAAAALQGLPSLATAQGNPNPRIAPPNSRPYGLSYGEWGAEWWKWALGIPAGENFDENPILDPTGEFADVDQSGPVWFLAGNFGGTTQRTVTVPAGKALFFPLANNVFWAPDDLAFAAQVAESLGIDPEDLTDEELIRLLVNFATDAASDLSLTIDGVPMQDLVRYRAESPAFHIEDTDLLDDLEVPISADNLAVADGYWIMLAPLPVGEHTIHFTADGPVFGPFALDVTYHITVVAP